MVLLAQFVIVVPTVGFDFLKNINVWEVLKELTNEQSIEGKLEWIAGKFISEVDEDVGNGRVDVRG
jgi:hypothetical protein